MRKSIITTLLLFCVFTSYSQLQYKGYVSARQAGSSVVSNSGDFLYISILNALSVYKVNQSTGMLTKVQQITTDFGGEVSSPFLSADNRFLYASLGKKLNGEMIRTFVMYQIDKSTGKLTFKKNFENESAFQYNFVSHFSVSPKGNLMFFGKNESNSLDVYQLDPISGTPVYLNTYDTDIMQHFSRFYLSADQRYMYVGGGNSNKEIVTYNLNERTGEMTKIQEIEDIGHRASSSHLIISADGKNLYKPDGMDDEEILQFSRDESSGMLQFEKSYNFPMESHFFFSDRNTDFIYGLHSFGDGDAIHVVQRDPKTGNLSYSETLHDSGTTNRLNGVFQMSFSKDNQYVYASGMWDGALNIFKNPQARKTVRTTTVAAVIPTDEPVQSNDGIIQNDRPVAPSSTSSSCTGDEVSGEMLNAYWQTLAAEESDVSRLNRSFELLEGKCLKVVQVAALAYLFKSEYQRLQFVKFTSYFLHDPQNKNILVDLFQYENMRYEVAQL